MRKILIAVDLQKDFIDGTLTVPGAYKVIPAINEAKKNFDLVYFTLDWHPVNHCSFKSFGGTWPAHCVNYTAGASLPDSVLEGISKDKTRFIQKGCNSEKEEYGAFEAIDINTQDLFFPGDKVVVCGIASEYCVLETLKNVKLLAGKIGFNVEVFIPGTACFSSHDTLLDYMSQAGIKEYKG